MTDYELDELKERVKTLEKETNRERAMRAEPPLPPPAHQFEPEPPEPRELNVLRRV